MHKILCMSASVAMNSNATCVTGSSTVAIDTGPSASAGMTGSKLMAAVCNYS